nr:hypothetical protein BaRGS_006210 [Batillaria attramentaria]
MFSLCLSPTILTCGHLVCRKCLRKTLETKGPNPACPVCGHKLQFPSGQGQTINELADSFAKDLILEDLVTEKLAGQGHKVCLACPNKAATKVCLDCGDMYCAACSNAHKKMTVSKDHVQQDLPQTLLNAPTSSTRPTRTARQLDDIISSSPSEDSIRYSHDTREQPQDMNKETLKKATRLCEKGASRLKEAITVVDNNMIQLQEVKKRLESQQQLLKAYVTRLARPDDVLMANARAMLPRLKRVCGHTFDPMTATPRKMFVIKPESDAEKENPSIVAIVATDDGRLIMTDQDNRMVKTADLANPTKTVKSVTIDAMPLRLTLVNDSASEVAVTADEKHIYFVDVSDYPTVVSQVKTARQYYGVASVTENDTLVVSCYKDGDGPASVDVITRTGVLLKTVVDQNTLLDLRWPDNLCLSNGDVLVSDTNADTVYRVKLDGQCVLVVTPGGQWQKLLHGPEHGDGPRVEPYGVCVTNSGLVVSLCLSPTILTCGHLVCRKCLRKTLETKGPNPACPVCGHKLQFPSGQGQTINEMAESFAKDLILEDLVTEKLAGQGHKVCLACPNKAATKICLDCGDMYCAACSNAHRRMTVSKDHVQQDLPQTLLNAPTSSTRPTRTARQMDDIISSSPSEDSIRYSHDTREGPQNMDRKTLKKATRLCEEGASGLKEAITVVDNNMAQLQEVKKRLESQQQLLTAYVTRLARPDDVLMANARVMLPRLERVCGHTFDPMTATPRKVFVAKTETGAEKKNPLIVAIVATDDGRLIMTDINNTMVKTADLANPTKTGKSVTIDAMPLRLTLLNDSASEVAVTAAEKHIYFVDVSDYPTVVSQVKTARQYYGVASVIENDTLVVSCYKDGDGPVSVDVITRTGVLLKTVVDQNTLVDLHWPDNLCVSNGDVLVSDAGANTVYRRIH